MFNYNIQQQCFIDVHCNNLCMKLIWTKIYFTPQWSTINSNNSWPFWTTQASEKILQSFQSANKIEQSTCPKYTVIERSLLHNSFIFFSINKYNFSQNVKKSPTAQFPKLLNAANAFIYSKSIHWFILSKWHCWIGNYFWNNFAIITSHFFNKCGVFEKLETINKK